MLFTGGTSRPAGEVNYPLRPFCRFSTLRGLGGFGGLVARCGCDGPGTGAGVGASAVAHTHPDRGGCMDIPFVSDPRKSHRKVQVNGSGVRPRQVRGGILLLYTGSGVETIHQQAAAPCGPCPFGGAFSKIDAGFGRPNITCGTSGRCTPQRGGWADAGQCRRCELGPKVSQACVASPTPQSRITHLIQR